MGRPKEFEEELVLDAAIRVFREHGYMGSSAAMLTDTMKIGRQSLYATFGDKWGLYVAAVQRYAVVETRAHLDALRSGPTAIDGLRRLIERVVDQAREPCLGVGSICEFGTKRDDLTRIREASARVLDAALRASLQDAKAAGDLAPGVEPADAAAFITSSIAAIRVAARSGANDRQLRTLGQLTLRAIG
jgi:AcrR family transcriptional regulator